MVNKNNINTNFVFHKFTFWQVRDLQKKMTHLENELDVTIEKLTTTNTKLDEKEKAYAVAESEIQALNRKLFLEQDELEVLKLQF